MARGRDTHTLRIDKRVRLEIIHNCSHPDLLQQIFEMAASMAYGHATLTDFNRLCHEAPCILWQPEDPNVRHVDVQVSRELDLVMIHVARVVWTITHTIPEQGESLRGYEELLHLCAHNGAQNTAFGACLNPSHLIRGNEENRLNLAAARRLFRKVGITQAKGAVA